MRSMPFDRGGHGSPLRVKMLLRACAAAAALLAAGCGSDVVGDPAPLDRFTFPTGLALHDGRLLVVSSNFDLRYAAGDGGSVLSVDPAVAPAAFGPGARIASFGGEIAVVDPVECGLTAEEAPGPFALVPSRGEDRVYRLDLAGGGVACTGDCALDAGTARVSDPFGVAVTCPAGGRGRGWVGFLRTPSAESWLGVFDLADPERTFDRFELPAATGSGTPRSFAYDAPHDRLFFTSTNSGTTASLRWIELGGDCTPGEAPADGGCQVGVANLTAFVNGAELTGLALGSEVPGAASRRLFVAARLYDPALAASIGQRPASDVGGALLVLELRAAANGGAEIAFVRMIDVGLGASEVKVLPREGRPDLVAVTASDDGILWIYDDEDGVMKKAIARDASTGAPRLGERPFGLAADPAVTTGTVRLYVGSFEDGYVTPVDVPLDAPQDAAIVMDPADATRPRRIGRERP